jgi:hypothetical protein
MDVGAVKAPTIRRSQTCRRSRQSVSLASAGHESCPPKLTIDIDLQRCCRLAFESSEDGLVLKPAQIRFAQSPRLLRRASFEQRWWPQLPT